MIFSLGYTACGLALGSAVAAVYDRRRELAWPAFDGRRPPLQVWVALACLMLAGCASAPVARGPALAHLAVNNRTDYEWRLVIAPVAGGGAPLITRVGPRESVGIDVAGGDYLIEQAALTTVDAAELSRKVRTQLAAGETYDWVLVTLLSEPDGVVP